VAHGIGNGNRAALGHAHQCERRKAGIVGHGFKIAPAVGGLIADLVIDGRSADARIPETDFRLSRFAEEDPLRSPYPYVGAGEMR